MLTVRGSRSSMTLKTYLGLILFGTTTFLVVVFGLIISYSVQQTYLSDLSSKGLELANTLSIDPSIINSVKLSNSGSSVDIQAYAESIRTHTDASFIVITNKNGIRLSHPIPSRIGKRFIGEDLAPTLKEGKRYSNVAVGSLGKAIRNFAPIVLDGNIIGAVSIGYLTRTTSELVQEHIKNFIIWVVIIYLFVISVISISVFKLKRTFLQMEPEKIVQRFRERELILNSIRDRIVAVDQHQRITAINEAAYECLVPTLDKNDTSRQEACIGEPLERLSRTLSNIVFEANGKELRTTTQISSQSHAIRTYPVTNNEQTMGYVLVFQPDHDETKLEEALQAKTNYANHLRAKTHEHTNKLNVLSGLLQAGKVNDAIELLQQESDAHQQILGQLVKTIENCSVAGVLLAQYNKAAEYDVSFFVDDDSQLAEYPSKISDPISTVVANLLNNATMAAWENGQSKTPEVTLYISDRSKHFVIEVEDSGRGIPEAFAGTMYDFGVSSKVSNEQTGVGLYLVNQIVRQFQGSLDWERSDNETTVFSVYLDKRTFELL
ncbi:ATP-binding protein [Marinomonas balearica]|uniref:histidine kinase n=1 Tax=Marinomonas balearica TaxID=491947 RepID=A0A4R6MDR0_9GAMM|nr:sensor histidine kinase [Marinomonas balearica]TDO99713.1 two-component system CitB family sensor kinase [Marinomonas balearica]